MLMQSAKSLAELENTSEFIARHIGIDDAAEAHMLSVLGAASRRALMEAIIPPSIARTSVMAIPAPVTEAEALKQLKAIAAKNKVLKSFIGQGYYGTHTPGVILRNILENPAWYTAYTPYQAEISQGRMEALINFQTMVCDLTGMPIANASMLDEATAAAEAMTLAKRSVKAKGNVCIVAGDAHPQTIEVMQTRAKPLGIEIKSAQSKEEWDALMAGDDYFAVLEQYPSTSGRLSLEGDDVKTAHAKGAAYIVAADLLALTLLTPPGQWGNGNPLGQADIVVGTTQRFGMPMGAGGPHAAYLACRDEFKRSMPGRLVGVSIDVHGNPTYRLALQTREQHIRREKATSNICTNSGLCALAFSIHMTLLGEKGLRDLAMLNHKMAVQVADRLVGIPGVELVNESFFNEFTLRLSKEARPVVRAMADRKVLGGVSLGRLYPGVESLENGLVIAVTEVVTAEDIEALATALTEVLA